jgi:hypothetical protein
MAEGLTINPASHRQVQKPALRKSRRSERFSWRENRKASGWTHRRLSPARKPFAIAQEFGDAKIQDPDRCEISRLAARPGQETGAGCGLAPSRTSTGRFLRRARSLTPESTFHGAVDRRQTLRHTPASSRRDRLSGVRASYRLKADLVRRGASAKRENVCDGRGESSSTTAGEMTKSRSKRRTRNHGARARRSAIKSLGIIRSSPPTCRTQWSNRPAPWLIADARPAPCPQPASRARRE